jgi:hypothetical protein
MDDCKVSHSHKKPIFRCTALQRANTKKFEKHSKFKKIKLRAHSPDFHIRVSVSDLYIPTIDLPILMQENMWTNPGNI